jgi:hypothetical protein
MIPSLLAIDPGMMLGWAMFNEGEVTNLGQIHFKDFTQWLEDQPRMDLIIVEDFRLFKHKALQQSGSRLETVKCIGIIESYATRNKVNVVLQSSNILPIAEKWTGQKRPSKHEVGHKICAYLHGEYYLIKNNFKEVQF